MATYFEGTATKDRYQVGKSYESASAVYTAQKDGSFQKQGNIIGRKENGAPVIDSVGAGTVAKGSSGNPNVAWFSDSRSASAGSVGGTPAIGSSVSDAGAQGSVSGAAKPTPPSSSGAGLIRVANPSALSGRVAAAAQGTSWRYGPWSGKEQDPQSVELAGLQIMPSKRSSNMDLFEQRYGDAEFMNPTWFASWGIAADDFVNSVSYKAYGPDHENVAHRAEVQKAAVQDVGNSIVRSFSTAIDAAQSWGSSQNAAQKRFDDALASVRDANHARDVAAAREEAKRTGVPVVGGGF